MDGWMGELWAMLIAKDIDIDIDIMIYIHSYGSTRFAYMFRGLCLFLVLVSLVFVAVFFAKISSCSCGFGSGAQWGRRRPLILVLVTRCRHWFDCFAYEFSKFIESRANERTRPGRTL